MFQGFVWARWLSSVMTKICGRWSDFGWVQHRYPAVTVGRMKYPPPDEVTMAVYHVLLRTEAVSAILGELNGNEGQLTASVIAWSHWLPAQWLCAPCASWKVLGLLKAARWGWRELIWKSWFRMSLVLKRTINITAQFPLGIQLILCRKWGQVDSRSIAQAISEAIAQVTKAVSTEGDYIFFAIDAMMRMMLSPRSKLFQSHNIKGTSGRNLYSPLFDFIEKHQ